MNEQTSQNFDLPVDGLHNFLLAKTLSEQAVNNRTVFPSGEKTKVINPNAKPFKLNPPK